MLFSITAVLKYAQHSSVLTCSSKQCHGWHVNAMHTVINRHSLDISFNNKAVTINCLGTAKILPSKLLFTVTSLNLTFCPHNLILSCIHIVWHEVFVHEMRQPITSNILLISVDCIVIVIVIVIYSPSMYHVQVWIPQIWKQSYYNWIRNKKKYIYSSMPEDSCQNIKQSFYSVYTNWP